MSLTTKKDSTTLPNSQLLIALKLIEAGKYCEKENQALKSENKILIAQTLQKDTTIAIQDRRIVLKDDIIKSYALNQNIYELENKALLLRMAEDKKASEKQLKSAQSKTNKWKLITILIGGVSSYLILK